MNKSLTMKQLNKGYIRAYCTNCKKTMLYYPLKIAKGNSPYFQTIHLCIICDDIFENILRILKPNDKKKYR